MSGVLIHIGYAKAGSTYLHTWFEKNPYLFYNGQSIAGFNNAYDVSRYAENNNPIHKYFVLSHDGFTAWGRGGNKMVLEKFKMYDYIAYEEKLLQTLQTLFPHAKILIVTRGYTTFFRSFYSSYLSLGGAAHFSELIQDNGQFISLVYDYTHVIQLYRSTFGAGNVKVLPYELLRTDPGGFVAEIETWLGISKHFEFTKEKINGSLDNKTLTAYLKVSRFLDTLTSPFPYSFRKVVYGYYVKALGRKKPHPFMKFISHFVKDEIVLDGLDKVMTTLEGKAEILRNEELYQPYLKEYLL